MSTATLVSGAVAAAGSGTSATYSVILHGNSLFLGVGASDSAHSTPGVLDAMLPSTVSVYNEGTNGNTGGVMYSEFTTRIGSVYPTGDRVYLALEVGNSVVSAVADGDVPWLKRLCQRARYWGIKTIICTCYPRADMDGTEDSQRLAANTVLSTDLATYADVLADTANIPEFTPGGHIANPTYFGDVAHLTDLGYATQAIFLKPIIETAQSTVTIPDYPTVISGNSNVGELYEIAKDYLVDRPSGVDRVFGAWGAGHMLQTTVGQRPSYNATGWNSTSPVITFDGTTKFLTSVGAWATGTNGTNHAFTLAFTFKAAANDVGMGGWQSATGAYNSMGTTGTGRIRLFRKDDASTSCTYVGTVALGLNRNRGVITFDGSTVRIYVNGALDVAIAVGSPSTGSAVGAQTLDRMIISGIGGSAYMNGDIAQAYFGNTAWSAAEVLRDYTYEKASRGGLP